jgi:hypothetical protein
LASTPTDRLVKLRSPFNGEVWTVPPDVPPAFVEELVKRGFVRVEDAAAATYLTKVLKPKK